MPTGLARPVFFYPFKYLVAINLLFLLIGFKIRTMAVNNFFVILH